MYKVISKLCNNMKSEVFFTEYGVRKEDSLNTMILITFKNELIRNAQKTIKLTEI